MDLLVAIAFGLGVVLWAILTERKQYKRFNQRINEGEE